MASAGEALVDLFLGMDATGPVLRVAPGGSSLNVAIGLARLGLAASFAGRISTDALGAFLLSVLRREGIDTALLQRGPEPTALALVGGDEADPTYDFRWIGTADRTFDPEAIERGSFEGLAALHVGSVALGFDPIGSRLIALMERLRGHVFLTFDPNVRRDVIDDWPTYVGRVRQAAELADLVKVSDADLWALGEPACPPGRPFGRAAPTIVTAGARGATLVQAGRTPIGVPAAPVAVVDSVGAGDAAMAALLFAFAEHGVLTPGAIDHLADASWTDILRTMTTAGSMACERVGADPPTVAALRGRLSSRPIGP